MTAPRGRPRNDGNRLKRLKAFELFAGGETRTEIAKSFGVTKAAVSAWAKKDNWDERLIALSARAQEAADSALGETIADIVVKIRAKYDQRLLELDRICVSTLTPPNVKITAIKAWFELGQRVQPDAMRPASDPRNLELIQDLVHQESPAVVDTGNRPQAIVGPVHVSPLSLPRRASSDPDPAPSLPGYCDPGGGSPAHPDPETLHPSGVPDLR